MNINLTGAILWTLVLIFNIASCLLEIPPTNHDMIIPSIGVCSYSWLYYLDKKNQGR